MKKILVMGGTRFFGKRLVRKLLEAGADVTIATRGRTPDAFGGEVRRLVLDREDAASIRCCGMPRSATISRSPRNKGSRQLKL